ncbi:hypothetical protein Scep_029388 [Stephania cephalantha]|uniref:Uncharacterized protein n=1 Tax=Stephania cephalantha TaxID=152367 RepID=A0AAP0HFJ8_9MAGN
MTSLLLKPISNLPSSSTHAFPQNSLHVLLHSQLSLKPSKKNPKSILNNTAKSTISSALAESDSPKSAPQQDIQSLIQDLSCGQELGEALLNLSRAWELADASTSNSIASKLPSLTLSLPDSAKFALGKRLVASGRRFQSMGQYGEGELQKVLLHSDHAFIGNGHINVKPNLRFECLWKSKCKLSWNASMPMDVILTSKDKKSQISKAVIQTGRLLSARSVSTTDEEPKTETRMFKVELTPKKANIGAAIGVVFGFLSWELAQGIQSIPESSLQYAKDNAYLLAKSLRGALLVIGYSSTILSAVASAGLVLLGIQLKSKDK